MPPQPSAKQQASAGRRAVSPRSVSAASAPASRQLPPSEPQQHQQHQRRSTHVGTALLLLATCVRSIAPMGPMVPGSEVGFTSSSNHHHHHHPAHGGHGGHAGSAGGAGANGGHGGTPNLAHAYTVLTGMDAGAVPSPHIDDRRIVGACGTDSAYTSGGGQSSANVDAAGNQKSNTGPESDPPRVRSTYKSFGGSGNGSGNGMTDDAVDLASDDDDDDDDLSPAERLQQRKLRAARNIIASAAASQTDTDPDAMSIESSKQSSFTSGDFETTATRTTLEAGARSVATAAVAALTSTAVYNADGSKAQLEGGAETTVRLQDLPAACLDSVLSYMPLDDVAALRQSACAALVDAADRVAPRPMPGMTFVRWQPQTLRTASLADTIAPARTRTRGGKRGGGGASKAPPTVAATVPFEWRCLACSALTNGNKTCTVCGSDSSMTACRIFVGQLRKQHTAELLSHLIGFVCPSARVLHIESHTNGHTGRSKGCAWVYLDSTQCAVNLTAALHKRAFVDVDANGGEGVWYTDSAEIEDSLVAFAAERVATATAEIPPVAEDSSSPHFATTTYAAEPGMRCPQLMPRQPVVAELPGKSLLAELALDAFAA